MSIELTSASSSIRRNIRELLSLDLFTQDVSGNLIIGGTGSKALSGSAYSSFINTISSTTYGQGNYIIGGGSHILNNTYLCGVQSGVENSILTAGNCFTLAGTRNNINLSSNTLVLGGSGSSTNYVGYSTVFNSVRSALTNGSNNSIFQSAFSTINDCANASIVNSVDTSIDGSENSNITHSGLSFISISPYSSLIHTLSSNITNSVDARIVMGTRTIIRDSESINATYPTLANILVSKNCQVLGSRFVTISGVRDSLIATTSATASNTRYSLMIGGSGHRIANSNFITILGGRNNVSTFPNTYLFGTSLTATQANTVYTQNIINSGKIRSTSVDLVAPNGTVYNLSIDNTGTLAISAV